MAIGDNFNDLSMLKVAGTSVGVQNCVDGIKPDCDYITKADCDHGAVAEAIEIFLEINKRSLTSYRVMTKPHTFSFNSERYGFLCG